MYLGVPYSVKDIQCPDRYVCIDISGHNDNSSRNTEQHEGKDLNPPLKEGTTGNIKVVPILNNLYCLDCDVRMNPMYTYRLPDVDGVVTVDVGEEMSKVMYKCPECGGEAYVDEVIFSMVSSRLKKHWDVNYL